MADDRRMLQISAALDGEAPMPPDLDPDERAFVEGASRVRAALRVTGAETPPDVTEAVLRQVAEPAPPPVRRPLLVAAAAVFVVAALAGVLAVRPGGPIAPEPASADVAERVVDGQRAVTSFDATVTVVETNAHPELPTRTLTGTLRYRAPEQLWLHLEQAEAVPGWPDNDIDLVLDSGVAWKRGLDDCPVAAQPACLGSSQQVVRDLAPFSPTWISPFDLVVPADAFLPTTATRAAEADDAVVIETTVARVDRLLEGLTSVGAIRAVHASDRVRLLLDDERLTLRGLSVVAADNVARANWATTNGYLDRPGREVLRVDVGPVAHVPAEPPEPPAAPDRSAGFTDAPLEPWWPAPAGFTLHRTGRLHDGGPRSHVYAYTDGRAWIRVDVTEDWEEPRLFGSLGPLVREIPVGSGIGYTDPAGSKVALRGAEKDVVVTGSVGLETLVDAAAKVVRGRAIDGHWEQAARVEQMPEGALVPPGEHLAVRDGDELVVAVGGPGATDIVLVQAPAVALPPPVKGDVVEVTARGVAARYSPRLETLTWLEDGWRRELRGEGRDLADLQAVATSLVEP